MKCLEDSNYEEFYGNSNQRYSIVEEDELVESRKGCKGTRRVIDVRKDSEDS